MSGRLNRIWRRLRYGGLDYLLTAAASYCPGWLFGYRHSLLYTRPATSLGMEQEAERRVSVFDHNDVDRLSSLLDWSQEKVNRRFICEELCFGIVKSGRMISFKWARLEPTLLVGEQVYTRLDPGDSGFYLHTGNTVPEERRKGLSLLCSQKLYDRMARLGRTMQYSIVEHCNEAPRKMQEKLGAQIEGEVYYVGLFGLRLVYRRKWPELVSRFEIIGRDIPTDPAEADRLIKADCPQKQEDRVRDR
ncbi:hypothetical protein GF356_03945 [candidate division GN15 bacterium]|nr:hypothetical protein [candidate division GN15 bacterium]